MRIRDVEGELEEPVNLLPLIDTLFFLVMFFLVATKFQEEEREAAIALPGLASSQPLSAVSQQMIINIRDDGSTVVAGRPYTMAELETLLKDIARTPAGQNILVRADERSLHKYFAAVATLCRRVGVNEVKVGYLLEDPKPVGVQ